MAKPQQRCTMAFDLHTDPTHEWHEINMTPLVDVMLVLQVIFMLTLPAWPQALDLQLPPAHSPSPSPAAPVVLTIDPRGALQLAQQGVSRAQLRERLQALHPNAGGRALLIQADQSVPYAHVAHALDSAQQAGWHEVALATRAAAP